MGLIEAIVESLGPAHFGGHIVGIAAHTRNIEAGGLGRIRIAHRNGRQWIRPVLLLSGSPVEGVVPPSGVLAGVPHIQAEQVPVLIKLASGVEHR